MREPNLGSTRTPPGHNPEAPGDNPGTPRKQPGSDLDATLRRRGNNPETPRKQLATAIQTFPG